MRGWVMALGSVLAVSTASAVVGDKIEAAGHAASAALMKAQNAAVKGVKIAASGVARGAHAAGSAVQKGAKKIGLPTQGASAPTKKAQQP